MSDADVASRPPTRDLLNPHHNFEALVLDRLERLEEISRASHALLVAIADSLGLN
jgi:hypothetical protein